MFLLHANKESFECNIKNNARKRVLFIQNVYKFCNNQIEHEAVAKSTKGETIESGALKFFGVNRLSKDLGVQYLISCKQ